MPSFKPRTTICKARKHELFGHQSNRLDVHAKWLITLGRNEISPAASSHKYAPKLKSGKGNYAISPLEAFALPLSFVIDEHYLVKNDNVHNNVQYF